MRLKQLAERRVAASASGDSLRPLSKKEVQQVAGGLYFTDVPIGGLPWHGPFPDPGSELL